MCCNNASCRSVDPIYYFVCRKLQGFFNLAGIAALKTSIQIFISYLGLQTAVSTLLSNSFKIFLVLCFINMGTFNTPIFLLCIVTSQDFVACEQEVDFKRVPMLVLS